MAGGDERDRRDRDSQAGARRERPGRVGRPQTAAARTSGRIDLGIVPFTRFEIWQD
ncbi:hypothetical protein ACFQS1_01555 [Paractinoplanes rhizophilus]|uniref:Uncharacterized protein n=1 Tax=Paractinoplanes rhizophilus TaxID=1416877 RepID=A0ABW2HLS9_9ACTN